MRTSDGMYSIGTEISILGRRGGVGGWDSRRGVDVEGGCLKWE